MINNFLYFLQESCKSLWRNGFMTVASISTVSVAILILGAFLTVFANGNHIATHLESTVQISVYVENDTSDDEINIIGAELAALPGVKEVKTVDKKQALARFKERLGDNAVILDALAENSLPYSFDVHVDVPERIEQIVPTIQNIRHVEAVRYGKEVVEKLFQVTRILRNGGIALIVLLGMGTLFIIVNTIRLTVFARRREISIMKYVGATNSFIRWPFLLEGIFIGVLGAVLSMFMLDFLYGEAVVRIREAVAFLPVLKPYPLLFYVGAILVVTGALIGALGSVISLRKFMRV